MMNGVSNVPAATNKHVVCYLFFAWLSSVGDVEIQGGGDHMSVLLWRWALLHNPSSF